MRKTTFLLLMITLFALVLAGCAGLTPPTLSVKESPTEAAATTQPAATEPVASAVPQTAEPTTATPSAEPACRVDTSSQTDPSLADRYPKVGPTDWAQGPEDAYVTIAEYSDFQ